VSDGIHQNEPEHELDEMLAVLNEITVKVGNGREQNGRQQFIQLWMSLISSCDSAGVAVETIGCDSVVSFVEKTM